MTGEERLDGAAVSPGAAGGRLVRLSAALAAGRSGRLERELEETAALVESGAMPRLWVEEALLQARLFLGYPAVLEVLGRWRERMPGPVPSAETGAGPELWRRRGEEVFRAVYGEPHRKLRAKVRRLHPDLERWMVTEGYGRVLGRPGIPLSVRELCVVAVLAVRGGGPPLHSHLRGALRTGNPVGTVEEALEIALAVGGVEARAAEERRRLWGRVRRSAGGKVRNAKDEGDGGNGP